MLAGRLKVALVGAEQRRWARPVPSESWGGRIVITKRTSTVGFPRESMTSLAFTLVMEDAFLCGMVVARTAGAARENVRAMACMLVYGEGWMPRKSE